MKTSILTSAMLAGLAMASPLQQSPNCKVIADCKPNEHCDNKGNCVANKVARDAPLAHLTEACHVDGDCIDKLQCVKDVCVAPHDKRDAPLAHLNGDCKSNSDCVKGLVCEKDICIAPKNRRDVSNSPKPSQI